MKILRENLEVIDYQTLILPADAVILSVAPCRSDREYVDLWYTDPELPEHGERDFGIYIAGTGHRMSVALVIDLEHCARHLGTCVMPSGLVWHVFEGPAATA
jgi:hypothetical protein